jgi:hypothetical protein
VFFFALVADRASPRCFLTTPVPPLAPYRLGSIWAPDEELGRADGKTNLRAVAGRPFSRRRPPIGYWGPWGRTSGDAVMLWYHLKRRQPRAGFFMRGAERAAPSHAPSDEIPRACLAAVEIAASV